MFSPGHLCRICLFPSCKYPTTSCFKLLTVQNLAPKISKYVIIESHKPKQASVYKPQEVHAPILAALRPAWPQALTVPAETQNAGLSVGACLLLFMCNTCGIPGALCFCIIPFSSTADPPSVGSTLLSYLGNPVLFSRHF